MEAKSFGKQIWLGDGGVRSLSGPIQDFWREIGGKWGLSRVLADRESVGI